MNNLTFVIVHFNTPELTTCLCGSIRKYHENAKIIIFDNSTVRPFTMEIIDAYYDNTRSQLINFERELAKYQNRNIAEQLRTGCNFGSAKHSMTIDWLCKNLNENFILCDSDILLRKSIDFIDENYICVSDTIKIRSDIIRISPMLAYINVQKMKLNNVSFFDGNRMHGLCKQTKKYLYYDTGTSFYEDISKLNLFKYVNTNDYFVHYGNGSWRNASQLTCPAEASKPYERVDYKTWLMKYKNLWM